MTRQDVDRTLRVGLVVLYAIMLAAGLLAWFYLPVSLEDAVGASASRLWALYMVLGGTITLVGVLRRRGAPGDWLGEFIGLPLLASAVLFYGGAALTTVGTVPGRASGGLLLVGFGVLLVVRWFRVRDDARRSTDAGPGPLRRFLTYLRGHPSPPTHKSG